ncbi:MAG: glycoside hydrolase family 3 C-terminal domain-containing protein [Blautia sp.]|nr:glycoside hydrolase family 3 C-terminal domain-containing protein [Blautia sp.]
MDIEKLISEMTLEEKASLLSGADFWHTKAVERLGIPSTMVSDGPHGLRKQDEAGDHLGVNDSIKAVCFPTASATAASFDREMLLRIGEGIGDACQHENLSVVLGPAVNIKRSPLCGRNFEYFSEDPFLAGELAAALIEGVQSRNVGTSIKHFAANNQEHRRMSSDSVIDERTLREIYLPAFEIAVKKAKPWTVMCSYNKVNGEYASQNHWLLTEVLRNEWGFDGYVMSDWGAVSDRVKGVAAGLDLEMPASGGSNDARIVAAVRSGALDEEAVNQSVRCILTVIDRYLSHRKPETEWDMEGQHQLAGKLASECMVLLKNEDHVLPFGKDEKVAVIGKFAREPRYQGGGSSHINSFRVESLMDALAGKDNIVFSQGYDTENEEADEELITQAVKAAAGCDKAVIVAGLPDSFESEGYDRSHMRMPRCQVELIERVALANPNTVVVLYNGSPVEMPWIACVKGLVEGYLGGQAIGAATKAVLWGEVNPCGRLPESFPLQLEDNPSFLTYQGEGNTAVYHEGVFVGYRYYDRKKMEVLFPFGFGLSYTSFSYSNLQLSASEMDDTQTLSVCVDVTNTGSRSGKEVVQLYVGAPECEVFRPVRELKGFEKIELSPGETKTVTFSLDRRAFAYWNTKLHDWFVADGDYTIQIGRSSRDIVLCRSVKVEGTVPEPQDPVSPDSIYMDLEKNPKAMSVVEPLFQKMRETFAGGDEKESDSAASEAVTDEMTQAMIRYMPLRGLLSFGGGSLSYDQLLEIADQINNMQ